MPSSVRLGRATVIAAVLCAAATVSGCGGGGGNGEAARSATQVLADAKAATASATSVEVTSGVEGGKAPKIDFIAGQDRGGGTITANGAVLHLILDHDDIFVKADETTIAALTKNSTLAKADADRWFQVSATTSTLSSLLPLLDIAKLPGSFTFSGTPTKRPVTTFAGQGALPLLDSSDGAVLYVATKGKPYILGVKGSASSGGTTLTFLLYGKAKVPGPPTNPVQLTTPTTAGG